MSPKEELQKVWQRRYAWLIIRCDLECCTDWRWTIHFIGMMYGSAQEGNGSSAAVNSVLPAHHPCRRWPYILKGYRWVKLCWEGPSKEITIIDPISNRGNFNFYIALMCLISPSAFSQSIYRIHDVSVFLVVSLTLRYRLNRRNNELAEQWNNYHWSFASDQRSQSGPHHRANLVIRITRLKQKSALRKSLPSIKLAVGKLGTGSRMQRSNRSQKAMNINGEQTI